MATNNSEGKATLGPQDITLPKGKGKDAENYKRAMAFVTQERILQFQNSQTKDEKGQIVVAIMNDIDNSGLKFVELNTGDGLYYPPTRIKIWNAVYQKIYYEAKKASNAADPSSQTGQRRNGQRPPPIDTAPDTNNDSNIVTQHAETGQAQAGRRFFGDTATPPNSTGNTVTPHSETGRVTPDSNDPESTVPPLIASIGAGLEMSPEEFAWGHAGVTMEKLRCLNNVLLNDEAAAFIEDRAESEDDLSCRAINNAYELFMAPHDATKGNAKTYRDLKDVYPRNKKSSFIQPEALLDFLSYSIQKKYPHLEDYEVRNLAILVGYRCPRAPQPCHSDVKGAAKGKLQEMFLIFMMSEGTNRTIAFDIPVDKKHPNPHEHWDELFQDAPPQLKNKLINSPKANKLFIRYGQLLYATKERRSEPTEAQQFSAVGMNGSHPHCAPACATMRAVLFLTLTPRGMTSGYDGDTQMSKEKLLLMLHDAEYSDGNKLDYAERKYLLDKAVEYIEESASFGAVDNTIDIGPELTPHIKEIQQLAIRSFQEQSKLVEAEAEIAAAETAYARAERKINSCWKRLLNKQMSLESAQAGANTATAIIHDAMRDVDAAMARRDQHLANVEQWRNDKACIVALILGTDWKDRNEAEPDSDSEEESEEE